MKHFLKISDLSQEDILDLLDLADQLKYETKHKIPHRLLEGKTLGMIFEKSSTRTRVSFEVGMVQLGGYPLFLSSSDLQLGRGEEIKDTARVLSRYLDGLMIRTFGQDIVEDFATYGSIPVINGLTDLAHPCQVLADLMTIREFKNDLTGLTLCYLGDGNNMANSLIAGGLLVGMKVHVVTPKGYQPPAQVLEFAQAYGEQFAFFDDPMAGVAGADILYTDVWASMGQEEEAEQRKKDFAGYTLNQTLYEQANKDCLVLHCLPAYRELEISGQLLERHADEIFEQAENRLHAQKAVLATLLKDN